MTLKNLPNFLSFGFSHTATREVKYVVCLPQRSNEIVCENSFENLYKAQGEITSDKGNSFC